MKKYKLTDGCITIGGYKLYSIESLKDFSQAKKANELKKYWGFNKLNKSNLISHI